VQVVPRKEVAMWSSCNNLSSTQVVIMGGSLATCNHPMFVHIKRWMKYITHVVRDG